MSKRIQTENLSLYAYDNLRGLPTFLKDWSDNMIILDGAYVTVNGLINALNVRLTNAESTLEDLSPESIEDYKIRLNALEKKVVVNTNAIKDVNTKLSTVNAQITSLNNSQTVQDGRLDALESITTNHGVLITALGGNLEQVSDRITTLETCCEEVQHEIEDIQSDINGFNDDVAVLAQQFATVSDAVSELTELVNSLQLDVVSQRLDAFEADLSSLADRMTSAEAQIATNTQGISDNTSAIGVEKSRVDGVIAEIGDDDYSEVGDTVSGSIVELAERIRNLTPQAYDELVQALESVESDVASNTSAIGTLQSGLQNVESDVADNASDIGALQMSVSGVGADLSSLGSEVTALTGVVEDNDVAIKGRISAIEGYVPSGTSASNKLVNSTPLTVTDPTNGTGLIRFAVDNNGNYGYKKVGADTVIPFKSDLRFIDASVIPNLTSSSSSGTVYGRLLRARMTSFLEQFNTELPKGYTILAFSSRGAIITRACLNTNDNVSIDAESHHYKSLGSSNNFVTNVFVFKLNEPTVIKDISLVNSTNYDILIPLINDSTYLFNGVIISIPQ